MPINTTRLQEFKAELKELTDTEKCHPDFCDYIDEWDDYVQELRSERPHKPGHG